MIEEWVDYVLEETWDQQRIDDSPIPKYANSEIYFCNEYGFIAFRQLTSALYEVHIAMLRKAKNVKAFSLNTLETARKKGAKKFVAPIAEFNKPAIMLAKRCGFVLEGTITKAIYRDGKPYSLLLFGSE